MRTNDIGICKCKTPNKETKSLVPRWHHFEPVLLLLTKIIQAQQELILFGPLGSRESTHCLGSLPDPDQCIHWKPIFFLRRVKNAR